MSQASGFRQSVAYWCLADTEWHWDIEKICETAQELRIESVELTPPAYLPVLDRFGLHCALGMNGMPDPPFAKGLNNLKYRDEILSHTREAIDAYSQFGVPNMIAFVGYKWRDATDPQSGEISRQEALDNCVEGLSALAGYATQKSMNICLEHLNTRDSSHPMKGHPGYQGDDLELCSEIIRGVNSPNVRLLFDVYHVQVMHGDVIRRIREIRHLIGHIHTAGNPGRGPLDDFQEIHYPAVFRALAEVSYEGFIGHEFISPRDPQQTLSEAVELCRRNSERT